MRNLSRFSLNNRQEVKFLQAAVNLYINAGLVVDGSFGRLTETAVKAFQKDRDLFQTGKADRDTLLELGFRDTHNKNIVMFEVPFTEIDAVNVLVKDKQGYTVERFADELGYDVVWNGGFFRVSTLEMSNLTMVGGKILFWGMSHRGIAYPNDFTNAVGGSYGEFLNRPFDMQGGAPVLIDKYQKDSYGLIEFLRSSTANKAIYYNKTRRCCTAITSKSIIVAFSLVPLSCVDMTDEGLAQKDISFMQNNDGGGSQSVAIGGTTVIATDGRKIPEAVGIRLKKRS